ncbi:MAG: hypothetical protein RIS08_1331 [Actinomycetota bacterium]|jgi:hypothetical protein
MRQVEGKVSDELQALQLFGDKEQTKLSKDLIVATES